MATIKSYTDIEQSKKLAEILPLESADMCYGIDDGTQKYNDLPWLIPYHTYTAKEFYTPCWSLAALLGVLPEGYSVGLTKSFNGIDYYCNLDGKDISIYADNPVDACVSMIECLHELNLL